MPSSKSSSYSSKPPSLTESFNTPSAKDLRKSFPINIMDKQQKQIRDDAYLLATGHTMTKEFTYDEFQKIECSDHAWEPFEDIPENEYAGLVVGLADSIQQLIEEHLHLKCMKSYTLSYKLEGGRHFLYWRCEAENLDHATEQLEDFYRCSDEDLDKSTVLMVKC